MQRPLTEKEVLEFIKASNEYELRKVWLEIIMQRQTSDEIATRSTNHRNSVGLSGCDAKPVTRIYESVADSKNRKGRTLFPNEVEYLKKVLPKYRKQFVEESKIRCEKIAS